MLILVLKDSLRTKFKSLSLSLQVLVLVLVLVGLVLVLVLKDSLRTKFKSLSLYLSLSDMPGQLNFIIKLNSATKLSQCTNVDFKLKFELQNKRTLTSIRYRIQQM